MLPLVSIIGALFAVAVGGVEVAGQCAATGGLRCQLICNILRLLSCVSFLVLILSRQSNMPDPRRWQPLTCQNLHLEVSYLQDGGCLGLSILAPKCVQQFYRVA